MTDDNSLTNDEKIKTAKSKPMSENHDIHNEKDKNQLKNEVQPNDNEVIDPKNEKSLEQKTEENKSIDSTNTDGNEPLDSPKSEPIEVNEENATNGDEESSSEDYKAFLNEIKVKKRKEHKFDEQYDKEIESAQDEWVSMMVYCPICKNNVFAWYRKSVVEKATSYPVYIVWVHGEPNHGLLYRVDKDLVSRGEKPVIIEYDPNLYSK